MYISLEPFVFQSLFRDVRATLRYPLCVRVLAWKRGFCLSPSTVVKRSYALPHCMFSEKRDQDLDKKTKFDLEMTFRLYYDGIGRIPSYCAVSRI